MAAADPQLLDYPHLTLVALSAYSLTNARLGWALSLWRHGTSRCSAAPECSRSSLLQIGAATAWDSDCDLAIYRMDRVWTSVEIAEDFLSVGVRVRMSVRVSV